jgi:hypothetical protein
MRRDSWALRLRHGATIARHEQAILAGFEKAVAAFLDLARDAVLDEGPPVITAAAAAPNPAGWPDDSAWRRLLEQHVVRPIEAVFGARFYQLSKQAAVAVTRYWEAHIGAVWDRLVIWPDQAWEEMRYEIAEGMTQGESIEQIRDRIADVMHVNAASRRIRADAAEQRRIRDDPARSDQQRAAARRRLRALHSGLDDADRQWRYICRRVARTEVMGAYNGGAFAGAQAWQEASGTAQVKIWLATDDARTRHTHHVADGQEQPLAEPFSVGGVALAFPGDPSGPGEEVIQCRCTLLFEDAGEFESEMERRALAAAGGTSMGEDKKHDREHGHDEKEKKKEEEEKRVPVGWRGVLAPLDVASGDRRMLLTPKDGVLRVRPFPMALTFQEQTAPGHDGAYRVGTIDAAWVENGLLCGSGRFDLEDPRAAEVARKLGAGLDGGWVSVELDDETRSWGWVDEYGRLVEVPEGALEELGADEEIVISADGRERRLRSVMTVTDWRLGAASMVTLQAFPEARIEPVFDAGELGEGAGDGTMVASAAQDEDQEQEDAMTLRALVASGTGSRPPRNWFDDPALVAPTPVTVTADGRVMGHIATWGTCHISYPGQCVTPPRSASGYAYFHRKPIEVDDGTLLPVGLLTMDTGHAGLEASSAVAMSHYDDTGTQVAAVRAGEDAHGVWVSGMLLPGVDEARVECLRRSSLSGDWRVIGAGQELVAALVVNVPGFPIPVAQERTSGEGLLYSVVAAGALQPRIQKGRGLLDTAALARQVAVELHARQGRQDQADALAARVRDARARALAARVTR